MAISRRLVLAAALAALAACGPAAGGDPVSTVQALYQPYLANKNPKLLEDAAPLTSDLRALMKAAREKSHKEGEPSAVVDFDPVIDGQDWQLSDLTVELTKPVHGDHATVRARFKNMGDAVTVTYTLLQQGGGWRIDNIAGKQWTLRQLLSEAGVSAPT